MATITGSKRLLTISADAMAADNTLTLGGNGVATQTWVNTQIANLVDSAPATLDTLNELAAALGDDPNFATTISNQIAGKLDSTHDMTLTLNGDVSGSATFTNMGNATLTVTVANDSHTHDGRYLQLAGGTMTGTLNAKTLQTRNTFPEAHNTYDLGTTGVRYKNVYAVNLYGDGSNITGLSTGANYYLDGLSFDTGNGVLTASVNGATNQTVDLDGRYSLTSHNHDGRYMRMDQDTHTTGGIEIRGSLSRGTYTTASQYHTGADNIVLKGNASGISGIFFESEKDGTNINHPSDFGYIQYHAYGTSTSGEANELIIGVSNDADDHVILNAPNVNGLKFRTGASATDYTVWHSGNFTDSSANWNDAYNNYITGIAVTGTTTKTITLTQRDGGTISANFTDIDTNTNTNYYLDGLSFDTATGILTASVNGTTNQTVDLDGRYLTSFDITTQTDPKYLRSNAADTATGLITFSGGITGFTNSAGISGNNFNITGVNQITINDPGEGIVFGGGASGSMTLATVDDSSDNILRFSGTGAQLQVGTNRVLTTADEGSGNGLDADTLDGQHASAFQAAGTYNTIIGTDSDINTSGATIIDNIYVTDGVITSMGTRTLTPGDIGAAYYDHFRSLGTQAFTNGTNPSITTAQIITEMENDGAFDSYLSAFKTSWSYAGNYDLTDAGNFTETAGTSWLTWTDNSSDSTRGNITALAIAPNTGGSAGRVFIYNDQGSSYDPGWREVWTNTSLDPIINATVSNDTITFTKANGSTFNITTSDANTNYYLDGLSFDTSTGVLTAVVNGATNQTVDLDGRYLTSFDITTQTDPKYLRSNAADTATGLITFSGGITGFTNSAGISGNNFNITGVNQITINDPGEGIVFGGGASGSMTLATVDDSSDNILRFSGTGAQLQVGTNRVLTTADEGSGNGLDADTLDGQHASAFQAAGTYNTIIGTDSDINTSGATIIDNIYVTDGVITSMGTRTLTPGDIGAAYYDHFRSLGTQAFTNGTNPSITTAQIITEMENDGAFDSYLSAFKTSWSYAGNYDLTDAGNFTETAGTSWLTWTDNSSDSTRGNITALAIAPNTGGSAGRVFIYNDQGSTYSPGWREVWTNTSLDPIINATVSNDTITFTKANGSTFNITTSDANTDTNYYLTGLSYNSGTSVLTATVSGATNPTLDLTNKIYADALAVAGNGTAGQFLRSVGDGTFSWGTPSNTTYSAGAGLLLSGTTFAIDYSNGADALFGNNSVQLGTPAPSSEILFSDTGGAFKEAIGNVPLSAFNNDLGWTSNTGDITAVRLTGDNGYAQDTSGVAAIDVVGGTGITTSGGGTTLTITSTVTDTTYSAGSGLQLSGTTFSVDVVDGTTQTTAANARTTTSGRTYAIQFDASGNLVVNVPWVDTNTNTTYTADGNYGMTLSGTTFRLENDRRRNSSTTDIYTGNTHDYTFYDADVGIRWYTSGAEDMRLQDNGTLHVDGDVIAYSSTISDQSFKDDVVTIDNAIDKVKKLRGVEYTWNSGSRKGKRDLGLIAQEVEEVLPEIVHEHEMPLMEDAEAGKTYKTVDYEKMVGVLIEAVKEQQTQIDSLKAQIEQLKSK